MSSEATREPARLSGELRHVVVSRLVRAMVQAACEQDRAVFDRLFDIAFRLTHGAASKGTGEAGDSERETAETLLSVVRAELEVRRRSDASAASR